MVGMSSVLPPARRGSGVRPVQPVAGSSRQSSEQQPDAPLRRAGQERTAWRDRGRISGESFIDAEFVEVLREAASSVATVGPVDETLRQALEAYRRAGRLHPSLVGSVVDIPT